MNFYPDFGGWTLVFAVLVSAVVCDAFGIWMDGFRRIEIRRRDAGPLCFGCRGWALGDHCSARRRTEPTLGVSSQTARWPHGWPPGAFSRFEPPG